MDIYIDKKKVGDVVRAALKEDIGPKDVTTSAVIPKGQVIRAHIISKGEGVICGLQVCEMVFNILDSDTRFKPQLKDGDSVHEGMVVGYVEGLAAHILIGERVALNFLGSLSGIATKTREFVKRVSPHPVKVMDTRKTTPGLRYLERYAVRVGGGYNHRSGLWDQVLIKDNHIAILKSISSTPLGSLISYTRKRIQKNIKVEIEVSDLAEFEDALKAGPDIIMLDNMPPEDIKKAVSRRNRTGKYPLLEISGNMTLENIARYAECGADIISVGSLTHSVDSIDLSMEVDATL